VSEPYTATPAPEFPNVVLEDAVVADACRRYADKDAVFVVSGSGQGIGTAIVEQLLERSVGSVICLGRQPDQSAGLDALAAEHGADRVQRVRIDLSAPATIDAAAATVHELGNGRVDMLVNVAGVLGDGKVDPGPERTARKLDSDWMRHTFDLNVFGHAQLTGALFGNGCLRVGRKKNRTRPAAVVGTLTARVGSIGDNRLGGWYSYRMSKAAMNQFTKTFALEASRDNCFPISLHPGTVDTGLSLPFQKGVPEGKLFTPHFSASRMLAVLDRIDETRAGGFFDWKGDAIPW